MWFKNIFRPRTKSHDSVEQHTRATRQSTPRTRLFDEVFLRRMERLSLQTQRSLRGVPVGGEHPSRWQLPSSVFSDHRPYSSGDDLRYVDWNAYARHDAVLMKLGEAEQDIDVHLLLDVSRSMMWGEPPKIRAAQQLVGALSYLALAHGDRVRVVPFAGRILPGFGPAQGKRRLPELLRHIETVSAQQETGLTGVLQQHARQHPRGGLLVMCSDLLAPEGLAEGLRLLQPPRWQVLVLHLLDPQEIQPEISGMLELEDSETGRRIPIALDSVAMETYRRNVTGWQLWLSKQCVRHGATYYRLSTAWPLESTIIPFLRTRRVLR